MQKFKFRLKPGNIMFWLTIIFVTIIVAVPVLFIVFTSLKTKSEFFTSSIFSAPETLNFQNYIDALIGGKMWLYIKNTLLICVIKVPLGIIIEAMAAYAITKLRIKHKNGVFIFFLVGMMIPIQVCLVPLSIFLVS